MNKNIILRKIIALILFFAIISGFLQPLAFAKGMQINAKSNLNDKFEASKSESSLPSSDAINFSSFDQSVDPRTGAFSINYPIFDIKSRDFESPNFQLLLKYNSLFTGQKYFDVGRGWSWNVTHYDSKSNMIYLSHGGIYKIDFSKKNLMKNYLLKDIFLEFSGNFIVVNYKNGTKEYVYKNSGNLYKIENLTGKSLYFEFNQSNRLNLIYYKNNISNKKQNAIEIQYVDDKFIIIKKIIEENKDISTVIKKSKNGNYLESIANPENQITKFEYKVPINKNYDSKFLFSSIKNYTGTEIKVNYLKEGLGAEGGLFFPAVSEVITSSLPQKQFSNEVINYRYSEKNNYLGEGFRGSVSKNQDKLFFTPNNYVYSTTERKLAADQKMLETERTYNHYHLLLSEKTKLNGNLIFLKEYDYPEWQSKNFDSLDENYNLPVQIKTTYFNNNKSRTEISKFYYDKFGNILKEEMPNGIVKEYSYLSQDETFNKMTHLLKQEKQYSINDNKVKIIENKYINIKNYNNNYIQLLEEKIYVFSSINCDNYDKKCDFLYRKENFIYNLDFNKNNFFTLPNKVVVSGDSLNGVNKYYIKLITYENNESYSSISTDYYSGDNILLAMEFNYYNPFTGNLVKEKSKEGIEKQFEYDLIGRVTKIYLIDEKEQKHLFKNYTYNINNEDVLEGYGTSSKRVQSLDGKIELSVYDSLGRVINIYQKNHEENKFYLLKSYLYGVTGQKIEEKTFNKDANNNLYFTVNDFEYDYLGRETLKKHPSGIQSLTLYDDVEQTITYQLQSIDKTIIHKKVIYNNNFKLPVREEYYNTKDNLVYQKNWIYDGCGNKIKFIDSNSSETFYEYNNLLQLVKISNAKLVSFFYSYDPLYLEKPVSISVMQNGKNKKLLAYQVFNELGKKTVDGDSFGKENRYTYDIKGNLITKLFKSGMKTDYYYDGLNNLVKKESINHNIKDVSYYDYDPATLLLQSETNSIGKLKYNYDKNGNLLSVIYPDNRSISYSYDFYRKIISIKDIKDIETIYNYNYQTGLLESTQFLIPGQDGLNEFYFYDNFARLSLKIMPNKNMVRYDYNDMSQLSNISNLESNNNLILGYSLVYYNNGNILSRERIEGGSSIIVSRENYHYDALNNLSDYFCEGNYCPKNYNGKTIVAQNFEFDDLNNINKIKTTSLGHEIDVIRYNYSEINPVQVVSIIHNDKEKIFEYNDDGQMIKDDQENQFFYNSSQKIEKIRFSNGNEIAYNYLANGSLYFNRNYDNSYSYLYYHGSKVLNQLDSEKITSYFLGTKNIIGHIDDAESGLRPLFYLTDQASSVIKVINNKNENIYNFIYTPYGEATDLSTTQVSYNNKFSYGFNGELFDKTSGFQILGNGYRAYSPRLQRFIQYDEHSPFGKGGINAYIYANNNPIMLYDPTGENAESILWLGVLGALLGVAGVMTGFGTAVGWSITAWSAMAAQSSLKFTLLNIGLVAGVSTGALYIASSGYSYQGAKALEFGDKNKADRYSEISEELGWSALALGILTFGSGFSFTKANMSSRSVQTSFISRYTRSSNQGIRNARVARSVSNAVRQSADQALALPGDRSVFSEPVRSFFSDPIWNTNLDFTGFGN